MEDNCVGYFEVRLAGGESNATQDLIDIHGNEQFYLGRNPDLCKRHWPDPTISNKHLRIHCILYDNTGEVPPLVYATDISSNGTFVKKANETRARSQTSDGVLMIHKHGAFLLDDKDELRISDTVTLIYHDIEPAQETRLTLTQEREKRHFASRYLITGRLLGKGGFGKVIVGIHQKTQRLLACKVINLRNSYQGDVIPNLRLPTGDESQPSIIDDSESVKRWPSKVTKSSREFRILKNLSHPNIISVEKVFWSPSTIYMFEELITGGDLFSFMERKGGRLNDVQTAIVVHQILKAVDYLHDRNIVHRDLKPDNILLTFPDDGARIVITDFGSARILPKDNGAASGKSTRMFTQTGTLEYVAPEVHGKNRTIPKELGYCKAVDMWSVGIIAATLLSGEAMFGAARYVQDPREVILHLASECDISVIDDPEHPIWPKVSHRPKDFLKNLLVLREEDRMSAKQALAHPWFSNKWHAAEFEALYQRSILDWQPRRKVANLIEPIYPSGPSAEDSGRATQLRSHHFSRHSLEASFHSFEERFSGSQDWDLSVVYPPMDESIAVEHEEAQYDGPGAYDHQSHDLETNASYKHCGDSAEASMQQVSLYQDPPASGMYDFHEAASDSYQDSNTGNKALARLDSQPAQRSPVERRTPSSGAQTSIVYETPPRDPRPQESTCYNAICM